MTAGRPSFATIERVGRVRLSEHFWLRDFLYSETAVAHGLVNLPDDLDLAVEAGTQLCRQLLEPLQQRFGRLHIRSAFRSCEVNALGNRLALNCARNEANYADHIWDRRDAEGHMGATACIIVPELADRLQAPGAWLEFAWWLHDHLPYSTAWFFPAGWALNLQWRENPVRRIDSYAGWQDGALWKAKGTLTRPDMANHDGDHSALYPSLASRPVS